MGLHCIRGFISLKPPHPQLLASKGVLRRKVIASIDRLGLHLVRGLVALQSTEAKLLARTRSRFIRILLAVAEGHVAQA